MLNELAEEIHHNAVKHGWYVTPPSFGETIALCHSELSEALEEYRNHMPKVYLDKDGKLQGMAVEMIDCIIRILDWLSSTEADIDYLMSEKMKYNKTRPYRHGGKKI